MKVLWFSPTLSIAGDYLNDKPLSGGWIKTLDKEIQNEVELFVAFYYHKDVPAFKIGETVYYPVEKRKKSGFSYLKQKVLNEIEPKSDIQKFRKIIDEVQPDLIHIHGTERPFGLIQEFSDIPAVVSIQGNISVCTYRFFSGISFWDVFRYSGLRSRLSFNTYINRYKFFKKQGNRERKIFRLTKNFIGRTSWDRRVVSVLSPDANYFHNDEILSEVFYTNEWSNRLDSTLKIFTTTGPDIYKGIETLLYCAHLLESNNICFEWKVAGIGRRDHIVRLAEKSKGIKVSENIQFMGRLTSEGIKDLILDSHLYVAISHIENSPNSLCEALLLGVPCVATNAGGTASFVEDRKNGILIQDGDPYAMAGSILELQGNYDVAIQYGKNARERAQKKHDKTRIVGELLDIYQQVLSANRQPVASDHNIYHSAPDIKRI